MMTAAIISGARIRANTTPQPLTYFLPAAHWAAVSYFPYGTTTSVLATSPPQVITTGQLPGVVRVPAIHCAGAMEGGSAVTEQPSRSTCWNGTWYRYGSVESWYLVPVKISRSHTGSC
jgi:hypothetical protein